MQENNYQLTTSVNEGIIEIVVRGELSKEAIDMLHTEVIASLRGNKAKAILADVRDSTGPHDIIEAYFRVRSIPPDVRRLPSAVVDRREYRDYKSFYETTSANAGMSIRWFTDIESARVWLRSRLDEMRRE